MILLENFNDALSLQNFGSVSLATQIEVNKKKYQGRELCSGSKCTSQIWSALAELGNICWNTKQARF